MVDACEIWENLFCCTSKYKFYLGVIHKFIPQFIYRWGFTRSNHESISRPDQDVIFPYPYSRTITILTSMLNIISTHPKT